MFNITDEGATPELLTLFENNAKEIQSSLPALTTLSKEQAQTLIQRYVAAIEGNFVPWFCAVTIYARSPQAKYAAMENLDVEIRDDHQGMLRAFAIGAKAEPTHEHYQAVLPHVSKMRKIIAEGSGLKSITVSACLEYFSKEFVPYLAELAKKCDSTNFQYTDIHGEADAIHANQCLWAIEHEAKWGYMKPEVEIEKTINASRDFIKTIFQKSASDSSVQRAFMQGKK
ncbi:MAG: hypothetical protein IPJ89_02340 [Candidatus Iainarchaeum archaeon]|uniref:Iron-containing redox enzyme family protein n=1 Tax=Candidatus Iainarchaeum sp. TaxID=3101447 RepID=A0A7T9DKL5_9ARCH|nr:MAG: hypothetical protein IPJ89_02340 [Candidatus Diapherotrites archaeon]